MLPRLLKPRLAFAGVVALTSYYGSRIYSSVSLPPGLSIASSNEISNSLAHSRAVSIVNPRHHISINDTRSVLIPVQNDISHEQILANFLSAFFGGYVFAPERMVLRLFGQQLVNFKGLNDTPLSKAIWTVTGIDSKQTPPLHSLLFGAFRIIDIHQSGATDPSSTSRSQTSYIDIVYGGDAGIIAGVHRFSVVEVEDLADVEGKGRVVVRFESTSCYPKENKPLGPDILQTFHLWYAMLLFREGVASVLKAG